MERGPAELLPELAAAVGEHLNDFVEDQVKSGRCRDGAELVRAALHLLESHGVPDGLPSDAEVRAMVEEGSASGVSDEHPDASFGRLDAGCAALAAAQREGG